MSNEDFLKFCQNLPHYLSIEAVPDDAINRELAKKQAPDAHYGHFQHWVGYIGNLRINFIHYRSPEDAIEKWNRRRKRVNLDNLIIKFDDNCADEEWVKKMASLPYPKIFFTVNPDYVRKYDFAYLLKADKKGNTDYLHQCYHVLKMGRFKKIANKLK